MFSSKFAKRKKAVSPVIATVLIIALTIAAAAIVWLVVMPMVNQKNAPQLYYDSTYTPIYKDYDNDGNCDYMAIQIGDMVNTGFNVSNITIAYSTNNGSNALATWDIMYNTTSTIAGNSRTLLRMYAHTDDVDEIPNFSNIVLNLYDGKYLIPIEVGSINVEQGEPVILTFTDNSGDPVIGASVYYYYSTGEFAYTGQVTDNNGHSRTYLFPGVYYAKAQTGVQFYSTDMFVHPGEPQLSLHISGGTLQVKVKSGSTPLTNVRTYLYDTNGHYLNKYQDTNSDGIASYSLEDGVYKIRADVSGIVYYSQDVLFPNVTYVEIDTGGGTLYCRVLDGSNTTIPNVRTYLFSASGRYQGKYANTNASGIATYTAVPGGQAYKIRADYLGHQIWSQEFGASDGAVVDINVGGGTIYINVTDSDGHGIANTRTYLFTSNNRYSGKYANTNSTGIATYTRVAMGDYKIRIDYLAMQFWSPDFTAQNGLVVQASIGGGTIYGNITAGGNAVVNTRVYLFTSNNRYTGKYGNTNSSGIVVFQGIGTGNYRFRVDYQAYQHWSDVFEFNKTTVVPYDVGGGTVYAYVTAGGTPIANARVYVFTSTYRYTGVYANTNSTGYATFNTLANGDYRFRLDYLGKQFWSDEFTASDGLVVNFDVGGGTIAIHVVNDYGTNIANTRIYLFTENYRYTGKYNNTNSTGWAIFSGIGESTYRVRIDYIGYQYWSEIFTATDGLKFNTSIGGGIVWMHVYDGSGTDISGPRAYLFTENGRYTGVYRNLNDTGYVEFAGIGNGTFKWRVDYLAKQYWSPTFTAVNGTVVQFNIGGGTIYVHLTVDGSEVSNGRIYLFTSNSRYTGVSVVTNSTGWAMFTGIGAGDFKLRYSVSSTYYWKDFTASAGLKVEFTIVTSLQLALNSAAAPVTYQKHQPLVITVLQS